MSEERLKIPSYLVDEIEEEKDSERVTFIMKGGIKFISKKSDFQDYEKFKEAIKRHQRNRRRPQPNKHGPSTN